MLAPEPHQGDLPAPNKRKTHVSEWEPAELPSLPVLVNKKVTKKHTKLSVFQAEKKKADKGKTSQKSS